MPQTALRSTPGICMRRRCRDVFASPLLLFALRRGCAGVGGAHAAAALAFARHFCCATPRLLSTAV